MVYPDASTIESPAVTLPAFGTAALFYHLNSAASISRAVMAMPILRGAIDELVRISSISMASVPVMIIASFDGKIRAAATINPDLSIVVSPGASLVAGRTTPLFRQAYIATHA